jgi:hypothetical protein
MGKRETVPREGLWKEKRRRSKDGWMPVIYGCYREKSEALL